MIARILDAHPEIGGLVHEDLVGPRRADTGRRGLSGDQVLRIALIKQIHGLSYRELEFHLQDSAAFRAFVGLGLDEWPRFQTLQDNVKLIRPETWEAIHRTLIGFAREQGIERGKTIRADTTVVEANIHEPADSSLLWDGVRVMTRLLRRMAKRQPLLRKSFPDRRRSVKRRAYALKFHRRSMDVRATYFGHKICLTGGKSSLVLDCVVEEGNPADSPLVERTLTRHIDLFGQAPRQLAMDGGFASKENVATAKALGVEDMAFHKKRGIEIDEMVRSAWVFRRLRDFRSGIEGVISTLKRAFQLSRCTWRGLDSFKSYVWASVTSFNLIVLARHLLVREFA